MTNRDFHGQTRLHLTICHHLPSMRVISGPQWSTRRDRSSSSPIHFRLDGRRGHRARRKARQKACGQRLGDPRFHRSPPCCRCSETGLRGRRRSVNGPEFPAVSMRCQIHGAVVPGTRQGAALRIRKRIGTRPPVAIVAGAQRGSESARRSRRGARLAISRIFSVALGGRHRSGRLPLVRSLESA